MENKLFTHSSPALSPLPLSESGEVILVLLFSGMSGKTLIPALGGPPPCILGCWYVALTLTGLTGDSTTTPS